MRYRQLTRTQTLTLKACIESDPDGPVIVPVQPSSESVSALPLFSQAASQSTETGPAAGTFCAREPDLTALLSDTSLSSFSSLSTSTFIVVCHFPAKAWCCPSSPTHLPVPCRAQAHTHTSCWSTLNIC